MKHQPFTLILHSALVVVLAGALVTHFCGIQGSVDLGKGTAVNRFAKTSGPGNGQFPFTVKLEDCKISYYPGTTTPMDFSSTLTIDGKQVTITMNKVAEIEGWRFYQSGISPTGSRLSVSYDPWGTGITYMGYTLLMMGMIGFFFQRHTPWRALLKANKHRLAALLLIGGAAEASAASGNLPAMQRPLAANLGKAYVYWNDRVCPLQTMAKDVTKKLYGSGSYEGLTAEQVLSGWLFYYDAWYSDFESLHHGEQRNAKQEKKYNEQMALIHWLGTGEAFKIYPYHSAAGTMEWLSLTGRRPSEMSLEQWKWMQTTMPHIKQLLLQGLNIEANAEVENLIATQIKYAGSELLPSPTKMQAERIYNRFAHLLIPAVVSLLLSILYLTIGIKGGEPHKVIRGCARIAVAAVVLYLIGILAMLWWIGGHIPLSNGPEMMLLMGWFALIASAFTGNRMLKGSLLLIAGITLMVAMMGERTPRIGMLMPVLQSPLLSVHVMLVMVAYVFFLLIYKIP